VFPAEFLRKAVHAGEFSVRLEAETLGGFWDDFPWLILNIPRDAFVAPESHEGLRTPLCLVWEHSPNTPGENGGGGSGMEGSSGWVRCHTLSEESSEPQFISEKWS